MCCKSHSGRSGRHPYPVAPHPDLDALAGQVTIAEQTQQRAFRSGKADELPEGRPSLVAENAHAPLLAQRHELVKDLAWLEHLGDWTRIAVVTDHGWINNAVLDLSRLGSGKIRTFAPAELEVAKAWLGRDND